MSGAFFFLQQVKSTVLGLTVILYHAPSYKYKERKITIHIQERLWGNTIITTQSQGCMQVCRPWMHVGWQDNSAYNSNRWMCKKTRGNWISLNDGSHPSCVLCCPHHHLSHLNHISISSVATCTCVVKVISHETSGLASVWWISNTWAKSRLSSPFPLLLGLPFIVFTFNTTFPTLKS